MIDEYQLSYAHDIPNNKINITPQPLTKIYIVDKPAPISL